MKKLQSKSIDPYRILFPIGLVYGLVGVSMWSFLLSGYSSLVPVVPHPEIMIGGFLSAFALGFLMTALPHLAHREPASRNELATIVLLFGFLFVTVYSSLFLFRVCSLLIYLFLVAFAYTRFRGFKHHLPPYFSFVGFGVLSAIVGNVLFLVSMTEVLDNEWVYPLARTLYLQATMLNFTLGVGSFLVPALLGYGPLPLSSAFTAQLSEKKFANIPFLLSLVFNAVLWIDVFYSNLFIRLIRVGLFMAISIGVWRIVRRPVIRGYLQVGVWLSCWSFLLSQVLYAFFSTYSVHLMHLMYISGFSLLTFLVASRVTLAHGHGNLSYERKSPLLKWCILSLLVATALRLLFILFPSFGSIQTLVLSSAVWLVGACLWAVFFVQQQKLKS